MNRNDFLVFLPSNSSLDLFPESTMTSYKVQLANAIELDGQYQVGLREFHYPHTWTKPNIDLKYPSDELYLTATTLSTLTPKLERHGFACVNVQDGKSYPSLDMLTRYINNEIQTRRLTTYEKDVFYTRRKNLPRLVCENGRYTIYNDIDEKNDTYIRLIMSPHLALRFGFDPEQVSDLHNQTLEPCVVAANCLDREMYAHFDHLYIYCNLIAESPVGNTEAPLLRIADIRNQPNELVTIIYERPLYFPVVRNRFDTIEILIRDDTGRPIPFAHNKGRVICVLHFVKVSD